MNALDSSLSGSLPSAVPGRSSKYSRRWPIRRLGTVRSAPAIFSRNSKPPPLTSPLPLPLSQGWLGAVPSPLGSFGALAIYNGASGVNYSGWGDIGHFSSSYATNDWTNLGIVATPSAYDVLGAMAVNPGAGAMFTGNSGYSNVFNFGIGGSYAYQYGASLANWYGPVYANLNGLGGTFVGGQGSSTSTTAAAIQQEQTSVNTLSTLASVGNDVLDVAKNLSPVNIDALTGVVKLAGAAGFAALNVATAAETSDGDAPAPAENAIHDNLTFEPLAWNSDVDVAVKAGPGDTPRGHADAPPDAHLPPPDARPQAITSAQKISADTISSLVQDHLAVYVPKMVTVGRGNNRLDNAGWAVVSSVVGDHLVTYVLEKDYDGPFHSNAIYRLAWHSDPGISTDQWQPDQIAEVLKDHLTPETAKKYVQIFVTERHHIDSLNQFANGLQATQSFLINLIPGVSAYKHFSQGEVGEGLLSLIGDAAMLLGGPLAAFAKARGAVQLARGFAMTGIALDGAVGGVRATQGVVAFVDGKDPGKAAGYLGEVALQLFGVTMAVKNLKAAVLESTIKVGLSEAKIVVSGGQATVVTEYVHAINGDVRRGGRCQGAKNGRYEHCFEDRCCAGCRLSDKTRTCRTDW